jgi:hypothetical protein
MEGPQTRLHESSKSKEGQQDFKEEPMHWPQNQRYKKGTPKNPQPRRWPSLSNAEAEKDLQTLLLYTRWRKSLLLIQLLLTGKEVPTMIVVQIKAAEEEKKPEHK